MMPATVHLDLSLNKSFTFRQGRVAVVPEQALRFDARSSNLLNHANYAAVDGVVSAPRSSHDQ